MRLFRKISVAAFALATVVAAPAMSATLIGQTINAYITITGSDDNGVYTISLLGGPITIPVGNFSTTIPVFKQLTFMGFQTPSTQINGSVLVNITADAISVTMNGQVQPFELESQFTNIAGNITSVVHTASG